MSINFNYTTNPTLGANALGKVYSSNAYYAVTTLAQAGWNFATFIGLPAGTYLYTLSGYLNFNAQLTNTFVLVSNLIFNTLTINNSTGVKSNTYNNLITTYGLSAYNDPNAVAYPNGTCFPLNQSMVLTIPNSITNTTNTITYNYLSYIYLNANIGTATYVGVIQMTRIA